MTLRDTFGLAYRTVKSNKLRTGLTVAIIAFGIMALIGIITAIEAMNKKLTESFSTMGADGFTIRYKERNLRISNGNSDVKLSKKNAKKQKQSSLDKPINEEEAELFVQNYDFPSTVGISCFADRNTIIAYQSRKTSPNVFMFGA